MKKKMNQNMIKYLNNAQIVKQKGESDGKCYSKSKQVVSKSSKKTFPEILMSMLDKGDTKHAIDWTHDGNSFKIICPNIFTFQVLPQFFKPTEFSTFTRRLYWWGFKKITKSDTKDHCYCHEFFKRGRHDLCKQISSIKASTTTESKGSKRKCDDRHSDSRHEQEKTRMKNVPYDTNFFTTQAQSKKLTNVYHNCMMSPTLQLPLSFPCLPGISTRDIIMMNLQNQISQLRAQIRNTNVKLLHSQNSLD